MPEMPEVEVLIRRIRSGALNKTFLNFTGNYTLAGIIGQKINEVFRRGKYICFRLDQGFLIAHNRMSGFFDFKSDPWTFDYVECKREPKYVRAEFDLGDDVLRFHDVRLFGTLEYYPVKTIQALPFLAKLGPDALCFENKPWADWSLYNHFDRDCQTKRSIRTLLLDQTKVAGIGNIYVAEILWNSFISPNRESRSLSPLERASIWYSTKYVLYAALERNLDYSALKIYRRKECPRCNSKVIKEKVGGRSSYYCNFCQK